MSGPPALASGAELEIDSDAPENPRERIEYIAARKIRAFLGTIDSQGRYLARVFKQNRSLSAHVTADYHGRFLIELIQNGHDAHPAGRGDGQIEVLLDSAEGEFGTLYVANGGRPFGSDNVDALCEMGLSSKPPGEGIGNKGLGFRSVAHVTDRPEIYSRRTEESASPGFDGYRFTFAGHHEIDGLIEDSRHRELARTDLPSFYIPVWIDVEPGRIGDFAARGFSSVIRLPLRDAAAQRSVRDEIMALARDSAPIILFLQRLKQIEISERDADESDGEAVSLSLTRDETPLPGRSTVRSIVGLGCTGTYLVVRRPVAARDMEAAIADGLSAMQLPESWEGWQGDGEVALAVRLDDGTVDPRLYTFLPMGRDAEAPFRGHLHGSFFPTSNRKAIDPTIALNRLLLDAAATLAGDTAHWLATAGAAALGAAAAARAATDLLIWTDTASLGRGADDAQADDGLDVPDLPLRVCNTVAHRFGSESLSAAPIVPCLGAAPNHASEETTQPIVWRSPAQARWCEAGRPAFEPDAIARHGRAANIAPIWPGLGQARSAALVAHLARFAKACPVAAPTPDERAALVESIAASLAGGRRTDWRAWSEFYRDLPGFMGGNAGALAGRTFLFCEDGSLRSARPRPASDASSPEVPARRRRRKGDAIDASVFAPPRRGLEPGEDGDELTPPIALEPYFAFLANRLSWFHELSDTRLFLERGLISPFDSEAVLARISQIVQNEAVKRLRSAGLRWAFAIWRRSSASGRPVALGPQHRLFVPAADGSYIPATDAIFSGSWPDDTMGPRVQDFLSVAPADCADLLAVRRRLLAPTSASVFGARRSEQWARFLTGIGVQQGLRPVAVRTPKTLWASELRSLGFCADLGFSAEAVAIWKTDIETYVATKLSLPSSTRYVLAGPLWWFPGQGDHHRFTSEARDAYATLLVDWLETAGDQFQVEVHHLHFPYADSRHWPTPVAAFLRSAAWLPVDEPTPAQFERRYCRPSAVWLPPSGNERYPPFLRRPAYRFQQRLNQAAKPLLERLEKHTKLRRFNDAATLLEQQVFLTGQFGLAGLRGTQEREFLNIYNRTWQRLGDQYAQQPAEFAGRPRPSLLIARRGGGPVALPIVAKEGREPLFVRDSDDPIAPGLIAAIGEAVLDVRANDPARIGAMLRGLYGQSVRLISEVAYELRIAGEPLDALPPAPSASERIPWLRAMVAVSLEALRGTDLARLPADRTAILARLDAVELHLAEDIGFWLEGRNVTPADIRPAYAFTRSNGEDVVVLRHAGPLDWTLAETCLPAICAAIEQQAIIPNMRILARTLAGRGVAIGDEPHNVDDVRFLARELDLDDHAGEAAHSAMGERFDRLLPWLRAIVHLAAGDAMLERWAADEAAALNDRAQLRELLSTCLAGTDFGPDAVLDACRLAFSTEQVRDALALDFAAFNHSLAATGGRPDADPALQTAQLSFYVSENELAILDALRNHAAPLLERFEPSPDYVRLREAVADLAPAPEWAMLYRRLPEALLESVVTDWLATIGAPPIHANPLGLLPVQEVREANTPFVRRFAREAAPIVRTWSMLKGESPHALWHAGDAEARLRTALDAAGAFDFCPLDDERMFRWLVVLGLWPAAMPRSLDRKALGIAEADLAAIRQREQQEQEERDAAARSVTVNGRDEDPRATDWDALSKGIADTMPAAIRDASLGGLASLLPPGTAPRSPGGGGGGAFHALPKDKTDMIGRLGEIVVYHWLRHRYPKQDIDRAWVSGNAAVLTGRAGNDGKGYDFEIVYRGQRMLIEVKASTGDPCSFEMGETEVRRARDAARPRSGERYVIAYVSHVGDPERVRLALLPNPMSAEADGRLQMVGQGIRYRFARP